MTILCSCSDDNPVKHEVDPFADTSNIKFYYQISGGWDEYNEGDESGAVYMIDFNHQLSSYTILFRKSYTFDRDTVLEKSFIDSLDSIFIKYNFNEYPEVVPDLDSTSVMVTPSPYETIGWRLGKSDSLKVLHILPKPYSGYYKYPDTFEDFYSEIKQIINQLR